MFDRPEPLAVKSASNSVVSRVPYLITHEPLAVKKHGRRRQRTDRPPDSPFTAAGRRRTARVYGATGGLEPVVPRKSGSIQPPHPPKPACRWATFHGRPAACSSARSVITDRDAAGSQQLARTQAARPAPQGAGQRQQGADKAVRRGKGMRVGCSRIFMAAQNSLSHSSSLLPSLSSLSSSSSPPLPSPPSSLSAYNRLEWWGRQVRHGGARTHK